MGSCEAKAIILPIFIRGKIKMAKSQISFSIGFNISAILPFRNFANYDLAIL
ncbi:hypothetical protein HMPREF0204_12893 [Chryseobacterium gleum ATCC 35910]|uniref:Uncharacterized protein n=1 Tax=Chryseobacterium gleum ATCC 35910 TaxID=525257 RepID=A0ABP2IQP1_CHRGE|nr:hypothetical protein HMPREF0204_12893 [Chryseobacterium gleum ATCC 35910]